MKCKKKLLAAAIAVVVCSVSPVFAAQGFYSIEDAAWQESRLVYPYHDGSMYQVYTQLGHVTDIEMHAGVFWSSIFVTVQPTFLRMTSSFIRSSIIII